MSASLPARAKSLRERLLALDQLAANVKETGLLADLRSDLAAPAAELSRALDQRGVLIQSGITSSAPATLDAARKRAAALLEKFAADRKAATLNQRGRLGKFDPGYQGSIVGCFRCGLEKLESLSAGYLHRRSASRRERAHCLYSG